jgi:hypothetical protein
MRSALASAFTMWLVLVALDTLATRGAAGRVSQFATDVDHVLARLLDPTVAAIPDHRASASDTAGIAGGITAAAGLAATTPRLPLPSGG